MAIGALQRNETAVLCSGNGARQGFTSRFLEIARACEKLPPDTLVDGEVVAIDENGRAYFNALQHGRPNAHLQFYAFDILIHRGRNVLRLPLETRRELLADVLAKVDYPVLRSTPFDAKPADLIRAAKELDLEGIIASVRARSMSRRGGAGRGSSSSLIGRKSSLSAGYTLGNPFDALIVDCYENGELRYVSKVRNGFNPPLRRELQRLLRMLATGRCPFVNLPEARRGRWDYGLTKDEMENCRWLRPMLVAQIEFMEWTPDGHLRHSSFVGLRDDKEAREIVRE